MRKNLCEQLESKLKESNLFNLTFDFVEDNEIENISTQDIQETVNLSRSPPDSKTPSPFDVLIKDIHIRQLSCALKHMSAYKKMQVYDKSDVCLVLEDDIIYNDSVAERLLNTIKELSLQEHQNTEFKWDLNFLGLPQPTSSPEASVKISKVSDIFVLLPEISSYLIRPLSAKEMIDAFLPIKFKTNIHMSYICHERKKDLNYTMTTPNVFVDGSKYGVYLSSVEPNNKLILNQDYIKLYQRINTLSPETITSSDKIELQDKFSAIKFSNHPEIQCLKGQFEMLCGNYEAAKQIFEACYTTYLNNECILNSESEFLKTYAQVFKYMQTDI
jgi:GR25 family glycosyltransferase involved in LPS biosynthesis